MSNKDKTLPTIEQFKEEAKALRLSNKKIANHAAALDLIAKSYGFKNYHVIKPKLGSNQMWQENAKHTRIKLGSSATSQKIVELFLRLKKKDGSISTSELQKAFGTNYGGNALQPLFVSIANAKETFRDKDGEHSISLVETIGLNKNNGTVTVKFNSKILDYISSK